MTQQYDNTDRGALFRNDRKEQPNHPDYRGSLNVDGVDYWISAWLKESAKGKFMSLSVKPKDQQATPSQPPAPPQREQRNASPRPVSRAPVGSHGSGFDDMSDDVPF